MIQIWVIWVVRVVPSDVREYERILMRSSSVRLPGARVTANATYSQRGNHREVNCN